MRERGRGGISERKIGRGRAILSVDLAALYCALYSCSLYLSVGVFLVVVLVCKYLKKRSLCCSGFYSAFVWAERVVDAYGDHA